MAARQHASERYELARRGDWQARRWMEELEHLGRSLRVAIPLGEAEPATR
jgi:hypothetical protein